MNPPIPSNINSQLKNWNATASSFRALHVALGLVGIVCPLVISAFGDQLFSRFGMLGVRTVAFAGVVSIGVFAGFDIGALANRWRTAWKTLNVAAVKYADGQIDQKALNDAYEKGEKLIGEPRANPFAHKSS